LRHLNYNHLYYFWSVAREGSIAKASKVLHLTPQTISGQLKVLEDSIGEPLFQRAGRGLALTEAGHLVNQYAEEIFSLGAELAQRVRNQQPGMPTTLQVGLVNSIAKLIGHRILEPVIKMEESVRIVCHEGELESLLGELAVHRLDVVLSDRPIPAGLNVKAYSHALGESGISFFAHKSIAARYRKEFPASLAGARLLMPVARSALRRSLDDWLERNDLHPQIAAEFEDSALMKAFGHAGLGPFPAPTAIAAEIERMFEVRSIGEVDGVSESYFAISPERKLKHPAILEIARLARSDLFS
jgi:LysR family transcriptional regulator, transcriptional activator of nhaA